MGYVYLLLEVDDQGNERHKIGITKNSVEKRVRTLQTGNSAKISILSVYESTNYKMVEKWLHGRFNTKHTLTENEWFKLSDDDIFDFINLCKKIDTSINLLIEQNHFWKK